MILTSVDGRVHLAQAREIIKGRKPMFIDKPLASTLDDAREIARLAKEARVSMNIGLRPLMISRAWARCTRPSTLVRITPSTRAQELRDRADDLDPVLVLELSREAVDPVATLRDVRTTAFERRHDAGARHVPG